MERLLTWLALVLSVTALVCLLAVGNLLLRSPQRYYGEKQLCSIAVPAGDGILC